MLFEHRLDIDDNDKEREWQYRYLKETESAAVKVFDSISSDGGDASGDTQTIV